MANIKDIARLAGVSVSTVSRVLNHYPYVSEEKKNAVLRVIDKYNYQPNINAIHLSRGKTYLIGVVIPFANHPYFGTLMEGIAKEALNHNYKLVIFQTNYIEQRELEALIMLKNKQIDALIICSRISTLQLINEYIEFGPIILAEEVQDRNVSTTYIDHLKSFTLALDYLYSRGHRKIGYCIGRKSGVNSHQRELAYELFLEKHQLPYQKEFIFANCFHFEDGEKVIHHYRKLKNPPTALLVTSDQVAAGIIVCGKQHNLIVPEQLAIIGFDNQPIAKAMNITTLDIPLTEMGKNLLLQAISNKRSHHELAVKLIERSSV